jgi:cytochrome c-type protein NapC
MIGLVKRLWRFFWRPSATVALGVLLVVGFIGGILFWGGFHWALELTNTEEFCISCHEMRDNPYAEMQTSVHFQNRSGIRAVCSDCHVPKEWIYKIPRKIEASNEVLHHLLGTIDTPEKFNAMRLTMAVSVWTSMKDTDSRECRNCHLNVWMDTRAQFGAARKNHLFASENGLTCIDCHQGIAHKLPEGFERPTQAELGENSRAWLDGMAAKIEE